MMNKLRKIANRVLRLLAIVLAACVWCGAGRRRSADPVAGEFLGSIARQSYAVLDRRWPETLGRVGRRLVGSPLLAKSVDLRCGQLRVSGRPGGAELALRARSASCRRLQPAVTPITANSNIYDIAAYDPSTGDITLGNYINDFVGATTFYQTGVLDDQNPSNMIGIFGQDTYTAVVDAGLPFAGPNGAGRWRA